MLEGEGGWKKNVWYGIQRFFKWLEGRAYKMHVRVLLSKYRSYDQCDVCRGSRLQAQALDWRLGSREEADRVLDPAQRIHPYGAGYSSDTLRALPGLCVHDLVLLPIEER